MVDGRSFTCHATLTSTGTEISVAHAGYRPAQLFKPKKDLAERRVPLVPPGGLFAAASFAFLGPAFGQCAARRSLQRKRRGLRETDGLARGKDPVRDDAEQAWQGCIVRWVDQHSERHSKAFTYKRDAETFEHRRSGGRTGQAWLRAGSAHACASSSRSNVLTNWQRLHVLIVTSDNQRSERAYGVALGAADGRASSQQRASQG